MSRIVRAVLTYYLIFLPLTIFVLLSNVKRFCHRSTLMNQLNKIDLLLNPVLILLWMRVSITSFLTSCEHYLASLVMTEVKVLVGSGTRDCMML